MKKTKIITILSMIVLSISLFFIFWPSKTVKNVKNGEFDAQENLSKGNIVTLDGEWEFYVNELLTSGEIIGKNPFASIVNVPSSWSRLDNVSNYGYGTYRIILINLEPGEQYGLTAKNIRIASKIYVDGSLLAESGKVASNYLEEIMGNMPQKVCFTANGTTAEIVIQVSDFSYYSGGIVESVKFGYFSDIEDDYQKSVIFETGIFTTLIVIGIIFMILLIFFPDFRKKEIGGFVFPITVFTFAIINGSLSERIIKVYFKELSTEALIRIEYVAIGILFISLFHSIYFMEKRLLSKAWNIILSGSYGLFAVLAMFMPLKAYLLWDLITYVTVIVLPLLFLFALFRLMFNKKIGISIEEHVLILAILYTMNLYNLDIILFTFGFKRNINLALIAAAFYAIIWFFLIAYRVYKANEKLRDTESDLQVSNLELEVHRNELLAAYEHLEMVVEERTRDLLKTNELLQNEIDNRQKNEGEIKHLAFYDHLTNIPNRRYFTDYFEKELSNAKRYHTSLGLLFLDLDGFKKVNDNFGHDAGDKLLQLVAERLKEQVRAGDFVARLGGDEFVILLHRLDEKKTIERICNDIVKSVTSSLNVYGHTIKIGVSIGIVIFPKDGDTRDMLINKADFAMYEAKKSTEFSYRFFQDTE